MARSLDLVLLSDEPFAWEGDYWKHSAQKIENEMRHLDITEDDKQRVEAQFGIKEYFRLLPGGYVGSNGATAPSYRVLLPHRPHLSLADLATVAKAAGYEVRVVDNILRYPNRMSQVEALLREKPKAIGVSTTFLLTPQVVRDYVNKLRTLAPESKFVLGGPTVRKCQDLHGFADFSVFGDGEDPLLGILDVLHEKRGPNSVPHIAYRDEKGDVKYGPSGVESGHLNTIGKAFKARNVQIPIPDWRLVHRSFDNVFSIEFCRGCKYNCFYCSYDRGKNIRDLADIRQELINNAELGIDKYRVADSNFTDGPPQHKRFPHDVCQTMIDLDLGLKWSCYARVDDLSEELADLMVRAGCFAVFFGIESGSDTILRKMRKGHNVADAYEGVRIAKAAGMRCHASFIVGYPGETLETHQETLDFIKNARPATVNLGQFRVEHDTPVYGVSDFGLEGVGMKWKHKTMDWRTADDLVTNGNKRLLDAGVCLGTECSFPMFMGLGLSLEESQQMMNEMDLVGQTGRHHEPDYQRAKSNLRTIFLERFPRAIVKDQAHWEQVKV